MNANTDLSDEILEAALKLAQQTSWERLRLHNVAAELNITLDQINQCYAQKDDLVEAWYDYADSAMLQFSQGNGFTELGVRERLYALIMSWLDKLAEHKTISRDMLLYKLEPGHIHLQLLGVLRISRTVQWIREAAQLDKTHLQRILEEVGLTTIYLSTFVYWMNDNSENQTRTRNYLQRKLKRAEAIAGVIFLE